MTAYRQQALSCAAALASSGPKRPRDLRAENPDVAKILRRNVYGWFENLERGVYGLTDAGRVALAPLAAGLISARLRGSDAPR